MRDRIWIIALVVLFGVIAGVFGSDFAQLVILLIGGVMLLVVLVWTFTVKALRVARQAREWRKARLASGQHLPGVTCPRCGRESAERLSTVLTAFPPEDDRPSVQAMHKRRVAAADRRQRFVCLACRARWRGSATS